MKQILAIALGAIFSGCSIMNESQLQHSSPVSATENTARVLKVEATGETQN